jgi:diguanylate cyclase (GGDEF)-like protein/PAS domain S-box-containing protein
LPHRAGGKAQVFWLLVPATDTGGTPIDWQRHLLSDAENNCAMMVVDGDSRITAINRAFVVMTGFDDSEVLQRSPVVLSSGRHSEEFFHSFWVRLNNFGSWTGQFFNRRKNGHIYPEWKTVKRVRDLTGELVSYISTAQDISDGEVNIRRLSRLAYHDNLTGLPNRRLLEDRLAQAVNPRSDRAGSSFSLLYIDLDGFKPINDQLGHDAGDAVLEEIARRLKASVRRADTVARIGGDEFVILLQSTTQPRDVQRVVDLMLAKLSAPLQVGVHSVQVGASIGCARFPIDGEDGATLLKHADVAMYQAKQRGRNQCCFFDTVVNSSGPVNLSQDLWGVYERGELSLVYQPIITALTPHVLSSCEALLRWSHPVAGNIGPDVFIPLAEDSGAIVPIGLWVLEQACHQLRQWTDRGLAEFSMAINISPKQLRDANFVTAVRGILDAAAVAPTRLTLELSEANLSSIDAGDCRRLEELRAVGVKISIDDFGAGGTSVKRLKSFPVDQIKIDRNFIQDIVPSRDARAISNCFVGIGIALGIEVVAEGVETVEQADVLASQGCQLIQGYLTGKPMLPQAFSALAFWRQQFGARIPGLKTGTR